MVNGGECCTRSLQRFQNPSSRAGQVENTCIDAVNTTSSWKSGNHALIHKKNCQRKL